MARKSKEVDSETGNKDDELAKYQGDSGLVQRWIKEIELVEQSHAQRAFENHGERIVKKYRNADALTATTSQNYTAGRVMFNILHSNVQVLKPTCYSRMPKVVVERRFKDSDPVGRLACQIAERSTSFMISTQQDRFNYAVKAAVEDMLLPGRGITWLTYTADFEDAVDEQGNPIVDEATGQAIRQVKPNTEKVLVDPLCWQDYLESLARNQYEVRWRAKKIYWTRAECIKEFGEEVGKCIELDYRPDSKKKNYTGGDDKDFLMQATIYVIQDLTTKQKLWINKSYKEGPLKVLENPLKLDEFWECPLPLLATTTTDSTYPTPDFVIYEKLADELDYTIKRLSSMTNCVRLVGATSAAFNKDIKNMLKLDDGSLWPLDAWPTFQERGGLAGVMDWLPFDNCVAAIPVLSARVQEIMAQIYDITHIPDIIRGVTDANETLGAQSYKIKSVSVTVDEKRAEVQRFCREIISKMAEIIFEVGLFTDETISLMCGLNQMGQDDQQMFPQALQLLRDDKLRTFRVDIETDSTIAMDEEAERGARMEYITAITNLVGSIEQVQSFRPELMAPMIESALFAVRAFRTGRPLEGSWEKALKQIEENDKAAAEQAANQPPPPDYEMLKIQVEQSKLQLESNKQATESMKSQMLSQELMLKQSDQQFTQWLEGEKLSQTSQKIGMDFELGSQKLTIDAAKVRAQAEIDAMAGELDKFQADFDQFIKTQTLELEKYRVVVSEQEKMIEEKRLAQTQSLEFEKMAHTERLHLAKMDHDASTMKEKPTKKPSRKVIKIKGPLGEYTGEANEIGTDDDSNE